MNDSPVLDDLELEVARTLHAKADQVVVGDAPFNPESGPTLGVIRLAGAHRPRRRVLLAAAAAVVVAGLGAAALGIARLADSPGTPSVTMAASTRFTMRQQGTAGFVPATMPDGWTLQQMDVGSTLFPGDRARWQLFGGTGSPMARGVLVGTVRDEGRVIEGATHTVHGRPAKVGPSPEPTAPPGAIQASWIDGDVVHDALAVGMDEAEVVAFLDTLVTRHDPTAGLDASSGTPLPEVSDATVEDSYSTRVVYADPAGGAVQVTATSSDHYGGLLHRLAGAPGADGFVLGGTMGGGPEDLPFVSVARNDGWTVEVMGRDSSSIGEDPGLLDDILATAEPVTTRQLVDIGVAQPVTATYPVDGWTVDVHGTQTEAVAVCLTAASGPTVCTTAEDAGGSRLTAGSALVDGRWVVVAVSRGEPAIVRTTDAAPTGVVGDPVDLSAQGERQRSGDAVAQVVPLPAEVDAVEVLVPTTDDHWTGFTYDRPGD